jgi:hypothetical protein
MAAPKRSLGDTADEKYEHGPCHKPPEHAVQRKGHGISPRQSGYVLYVRQWHGVSVSEHHTGDLHDEWAAQSLACLRAFIGNASGAKQIVGPETIPANTHVKTSGRGMMSVMSSHFWLLSIRFLSLPFLIASWVLFVEMAEKDFRPFLATWAVWLALSFSPIDVFPFPKGGRPRLVPLVMGLPRPETVERAKRGEVILGGCIVTGFEPKCYLVW